MLRLRRVFLAVLVVTSLQLHLAAQTPTWSDLIPSGTGPTLNSNPVVYDPASNRLIVFGGLTANGGCCTNATWVLTNANGTGGSPAWQQLAPAGTLPTGRVSHSAVYDANNNRLIVFGGGQNLLNDVWVLSNANGNGGTPVWTQLAPTGTLPPSRSGHGAVYDPATNRMVVFGGNTSGDGDLNDTWVLTNANGIGGTPQWIQLSPTGGPPTPREVFMVGYDPVANAMTVFGGAFYGDLWILSNANGLGGTPAWQPITQNLPSPGPLANWNYGYDQSTNTLIFFGGSPVHGRYNNDVWALSSANGVGAPAWAQLIPNGAPGSPPATGVFVGTWDPILKRLMIVPDANNLWVLTGLGSGGLVFPVKQDGTYCNGKGGQCTPTTARIAAVFDHEMQTAYETGYRHINGQCVPKMKQPKGYSTIIDFENEAPANWSPMPGPFQGFGVCGTLYGYTNATGSVYLSDLNYQGNPASYLWYDSHPGYDYPFAYDPQNNLLTGVYPAISGCVSYKISAAGAQYSLYHVLSITPMSTQPQGGVCPANVASETGYVVFYLHLASYLDTKGNPVYCQNPQNGKATCKKQIACPSCPVEGQWISVSASQPIAYVGDFSNGKWGGVSPHLHFEVDYKPSRGATPIPIDPYGWCGTPGGDPYTKFTGRVNTNLWGAAQYMCPGAR